MNVTGRTDTGRTITIFALKKLNVNCHFKTAGIKEVNLTRSLVPLDYLSPLPYFHQIRGVVTLVEAQTLTNLLMLEQGAERSQVPGERCQVPGKTLSYELLSNFVRNKEVRIYH